MSDPTPGPQVAITEKTKIRLTIASTAAVIIPLLGATAWATTVYTTINETHSSVLEMKAEMKEWRGSIEQRLRSLEHRSSP